MGSSLVAGYAKSKSEVTEMTHVRSTWLLSSALTLREHGYFDRYAALLEPAWREQIVEAVTGVWLPVAAFQAHYRACDLLEIPEREQVGMGGHVTKRAAGIVMKLGIRMAREAGVTPWTALAQAPPLFTRVARGGAVAVYQVGPKEARVELLGYPVGWSTYARLAMRGCIAAIVGLVAERAYVSEILQRCTRSSLDYRVQWV